MVVKSATKKRLIDMGIPEAVAHSLANDRKMFDIYLMDTNHFAEILETAGVYPQVFAHKYWVRIQFHRFLIDYFKKNPLPFVVARPSPRSSMVWRRKPVAIVINRRWFLANDGQHDYDEVMSRLKLGISKKMFEDTSHHNLDWYPQYYEEWVQRNTGTGS